MRQEIEDLIHNLESQTNTSGHEITAISRGITGFHRSLQQKFFGDVILNLIRIMHNNYADGHYDGRNETACEIAYHMWESLKNIKEGDRIKYVLDDNDECHLSMI